jgi:Tol biopolymer transport system component
MKTIIHTYPALKTITRKLAAFAALAVFSATAWASPPGTGGGTIYYVHTGVKTTYTMNSDGTSQTQLGFGTYGPVSTVTYNGHRWFLDTRDIDNPPEYYPNGDVRSEAYAVRDDFDYYVNNNSATIVRLTDDITFQTSRDGTYSLQWIPGGQMISIKARRWSGSNIVEGGIYTASLQFGPNGNIIGLVAAPTVPAIPFTLDANRWPNFRTYGWDPTGRKVAYEDTTAMRIADVLGSPHVTIYNGWSHTPQGSPDGTVIAFTDSNYGISTIRPNGTHLTAIIRRTPSWTLFDRVFWSPTGSNIVCYGSSSSGYQDVFRAGSNGNFLTNLTNTPSSGEISMGWR